jgi:hypothetical protein
MSYRLQVLIPIELDAQLQKAAKRNRISKGEWVRRALEASLRPGKSRSGATAVAQLAALNGPTAGIQQMLAEIESGRR